MRTRTTAPTGLRLSAIAVLVIAVTWSCQEAGVTEPGQDDAPRDDEGPGEEEEKGRGEKDDDGKTGDDGKDGGREGGGGGDR